MPNEHVENVYGLDKELAGEVHETARRIAVALKRAYRCGGVSTRQHNEPAGASGGVATRQQNVTAGDEEVWHYHLHVFPRYEGDRPVGLALARHDPR